MSSYSGRCEIKCGFGSFGRLIERECCLLEGCLNLTVLQCADFFFAVSNTLVCARYKLKEDQGTELQDFSDLVLCHYYTAH